METPMNEGPEEEDEEDLGETLCGACGENYASDEFWICCDICEKWFYGKCVKITPAKAEHIKQQKSTALMVWWSTPHAKVDLHFS